MKLSLIVANAGKSAGQAIPITTSQFVIGRDPECNLRPASVLISKRHCAILVKAGQVSVRDFDSTNGTFINDVPVKGEASLKNGDSLKVGPLAFKVAIEGAVARATPTPPTVAPPTPKKTPLPKGSAADDDVLAMLLSVDDDPSSGPPSESDVPGGSTVMDLTMKPDADAPTVKSPTPAPVSAAAVAPPEAEKKPEPKKPAPSAASAQAAAKAILEKYTKRR